MKRQITFLFTLLVTVVAATAQITDAVSWTIKHSLTKPNEGVVEFTAKIDPARDGDLEMLQQAQKLAPLVLAMSASRKQGAVPACRMAAVPLVPVKLARMGVSASQ